MKTVEAVWEERNLGERAFEIEIEKTDSFKEINDVINSRSEKYFVVKVPAGKTDVLLNLQKKGFLFVETNFQTETVLQKPPSIPSVYASVIKKNKYHIATSDEIHKTLKEVREGLMFSTDKIAVDPYFSQKIAGQRYAYWSEDVLNSKKGKMLICEYDNVNVGFEIVIAKDNYCEGFLGGLYRKYQDSGLGFAVVFPGLNYAFNSGYKKLISGVSSNNFQMLKIHMLFGAKIRKLTYNLIKHL